MQLVGLKLVERAEGVRFDVHAKPRAKRSAVLGEHEGALAVSLAAPPVDGAANAELIAVLASVLAIAKRDVTLVRGEGGRHKVVEVRGLDAAEIRARLSAAVARV
jgi:uncharacterized protein (TIGR00251 family)